MYRVRRPTNKCHQIAQKCTKSHTEFQKFSEGDTPGRPSAGGSAPEPRPRLGKWKGDNPRPRVSTYPCFILDIVSKQDQTNDIHLSGLST